MDNTQINSIPDMQMFTGFEYLLIDIANQWGLDKLTFPERIDWAYEHLDRLETIAVERVAEHGRWKEYPLYMKAIQALDQARRGEDIGHMVGFDAVCSGLQIMSTLVGCVAGARSVGLVDPERRADAYTECTELMRVLVPGLPDNERAKVKQAVMTSLYGSQAQPKELFGEGTEELNAFYHSMFKMAPGACQLLQELLDSWQSYTECHSWILPDNHHVHVKVEDKFEASIEVDELNHATFTHYFSMNVGQMSGLSNVANVVHSIDAYVLRSLLRRCNYKPAPQATAINLDRVAHYIEMELLQRDLYGPQHARALPPQSLMTPELDALLNRFDETEMVDSTLFGLIEADSRCLLFLSTTHLLKLSRLSEQMLSYPSFPVIAVHDEFKCHPNHMNQLRFHYREIMAELAESTLIASILNQLYGKGAKGATYYKLSNDLPTLIRKSNYALC